MKVLGTKQFQQKRYKLLGAVGEFTPHLGDISKAFIALVYGDSGNGKTEYCMRLAKELARHGKVAWVSYEQGHGYDLQKAIIRNKMEEVNGNFLTIDPNSERNEEMSYCDELCDLLRKRNSPDFIFIDSVDYTRFAFEDYTRLKTQFGKNKAFIFISHARSNKPKSAIGERILYDGHIGVQVAKFIAFPRKNRFGGTQPLVIYEKMAREYNPAYFLALEKGSESAHTPQPTSGNSAITAESAGLFALEASQATGVMVTPAPGAPRGNRKNDPAAPGGNGAANVPDARGVCAVLRVPQLDVTRVKTALQA